MGAKRTALPRLDKTQNHCIIVIRILGNIRCAPFRYTAFITPDAPHSVTLHSSHQVRPIPLHCIHHTRCAPFRYTAFITPGAPHSVTLHFITPGAPHSVTLHFITPGAPHSVTLHSSRMQCNTIGRTWCHSVRKLPLYYDRPLLHVS